MIEIEGNIWDFFPIHATMYRGYRFIPVIPINTTIKRNGKLVMGRGLAAQALHMYPGLSHDLGYTILRNPKQSAFFFSPQGAPDLMGFAVTKNDWRMPTPLVLLIKTIKSLAITSGHLAPNYNLLIPRLGCGNGGLDWERVVKPLFNSLFGHQNTRVFIINNPARKLRGPDPLQEVW